VTTQGFSASRLVGLYHFCVPVRVVRVCSTTPDGNYFIRWVSLPWPLQGRAGQGCPSWRPAMYRLISGYPSMPSVPRHLHYPDDEAFGFSAEKAEAV